MPVPGRMRLPNAENSYIPPAKILNYLLADDHPKGGSKADFFVRFGFNRTQWHLLEQVLLAHGRNHEVVATDETQHGLIFVIHGTIQTPDGRNPWIRIVWMIDHGYDSPRFVTAYPLEA